MNPTVYTDEVMNDIFWCNKMTVKELAVKTGLRPGQVKYARLALKHYTRGFADCSRLVREMKIREQERR